MDKHAYLILAHKDDYCFRSLLQMIDDERNDIFIHMDKKNTDFKKEKIKSLITKSNVFFCTPIKCSWGGYSLIDAELLLLKLSTDSGHYSYYHLVSGQDLPIKKLDEIYGFFETNKGKEFIRFNHPVFKYKDRIDVYHFFQDILGRRSGNRLNRAFLKMQRILGVERNKDIRFQKGTQWFSITDPFARYVLSKKDWIKEVFRYSACPDELVIQTVFINSPYADNLYHKEFDNDCIAISRFIDWRRGSPYVFRSDDYEELINSPYMFARKFDDAVDKAIIEKLKKYINT